VGADGFHGRTFGHVAGELDRALAFALDLPREHFTWFALEIP